MPHRSHCRDAAAGPTLGAPPGAFAGGGGSATIHRDVIAQRPPVRARLRAARRDDGQSLVEFALVILPLMLLLVGIVQMGLIFSAYVTVSNAAREGARAATVYLYDPALSKAQNDTARLTAARSAMTASLGNLQRTAPQLVPSEQTLTYALPTGVTETDARVGQHASFRARYHLDIVVPVIGAFLPLSGGRLTIDADVSMVVN